MKSSAGTVMVSIFGNFVEFETRNCRAQARNSKDVYHSRNHLHTDPLTFVRELNLKRYALKGPTERQLKFTQQKTLRQTINTIKFFNNVHTSQAISPRKRHAKNGAKILSGLFSKESVIKNTCLQLDYYVINISHESISILI